MLARRPQAAFLFGMFDQQQGLAIGHQYDRSPSVPRPGRPMVLRVEVAEAMDDVTVVALAAPGPVVPDAIAGSGTAFPARPVAHHWEAVLPAMADGTVLHYIVQARDGRGRLWYADGKSPLDAATVFTHRVTGRRPPAWTSDAVVYQVFVDRFANAQGPVAPPAQPKAWAGGDLHGVRAALPYLVDLGVTAVWLTPIFACTGYHGYDAVDLYSVDERFGGDAALGALMDAARAAGVAVLLDLVPNHLSDRHPWFQDALAGGAKRDWFRIRDDGSYDTFFGHAAMPRVNLENPEAQRAMIDVALYWLDEHGIAGYRIDHVLGPAESFFAALSGEVNARHPDAWLFGEATATPAFCRRYGGLLDGATDFMLAYALRDFLSGRLSPAGLVEVEQEAAAVLAHEDFSWVRFIDNHDMSRALHVWDGDVERLRAATQALLALPGVPVLLYGTEQALSHAVGQEQGGLEVGRVAMRFDDPVGLVAEVRRLIAGRRATPIDPSVPVWWSADSTVARWQWHGHEAELGWPSALP
jgi:hypothetical protein